MIKRNREKRIKSRTSSRFSSRKDPDTSVKHKDQIVTIKDYNVDGIETLMKLSKLRYKADKLKSLINQFKLYTKKGNRIPDRLINCKKLGLYGCLSFFEYIRIYDIKTIMCYQNCLDIPYDFIFHPYAQHLKWDYKILINKMSLHDYQTYKSELSSADIKLSSFIIPHDPDIILEMHEEHAILCWQWFSFKTILYLDNLYHMNQDSSNSLAVYSVRDTRIIHLINRSDGIPWNIILRFNIHLTAEDLLNHPELPFQPYLNLFPRPNIELYRKYPRCIDVLVLSRSPRVTFEEIWITAHRKDPEKIYWSWDQVSKNPNLSPSIIDRYWHIPWNKEYISRNTMHQPELTRKFKLIYDNIIQEIKML